MPTRINLHPPTSEHFTLWRLPWQMLMASAPLAILILALLLIPRSPSGSTPLEQLSNTEFFRTLRAQCLSLESSVSVHELKDNFLTNERINDAGLRQIFQSAGLSHLLALSGSQTGPVSAFMCLCAVGFLVACLSVFRPFAEQKILTTIRLCGLLLELIVLACMVGLFQSTGALNKVLSSKITSLLIQPLKVSRTAPAIRGFIVDSRITLTLPWLIAFVLGQNPVHDLSFLLSTLGAHTAQLVSISVAILRSNKDIVQSEKSQFLLSACIKFAGTLSQWIIITALTSTLMCLFCFQLWPVENVFDKILANLVAGPLVLFLITPASLLVITCIALNFDLGLTMASSCLEVGLRMLVVIGESFARESPTANRLATPFLRPGVSVEWYMHPYIGLLLLVVLLAGSLSYIHRFRSTRLRAGVA